MTKPKFVVESDRRYHSRFIRGSIAKIEACDRQLRGVKLDADDKALLLDAITNLLVTVKSYS